LKSSSYFFISLTLAQNLGARAKYLCFHCSSVFCFYFGFEVLGFI